MAEKSRTARWSEAVTQAQEALTVLEGALSDLRSVQEEYEQWRDGLPENLQNSAVAEKLESVCDLEIENATEDLAQMLDDASGIELPLGFGRD